MLLLQLAAGGPFIAAAASRIGFWLGLLASFRGMRGNASSGQLQTIMHSCVVALQGLIMFRGAVVPGLLGW